MKILSPAGSYKCALAAIKGGADAVYLGLQDIKHQRSRCTNFSKEDLKKLMPIARKSNTEIHITFNSSYNEDNFKSILDKIDFLSKIGTNVVILSDIGLISVIKKKYPDLKISYSVQGQCANSEFSQILKKIGVDKIVFDRNMPIEEAKIIKQKTGIEVELFAFGYQCYSQDSLCYMGDYFMDEPCNVQCSQIIKFVDNDNYKENKRYFFMKYQSILNYIPELIEARIDYIKIEGRQRSSNYVYNTTKVFREAVDSCISDKNNFKIKKEWIKVLEKSAYGFELTDSFFKKGEYHRKIITNATFRNKVLYLKDIISTFIETGNFTKLKKELFSSLQIELNKPFNKKEDTIKGFK